MKKRFLPFSLVLAIFVFGQVAIADNGGHYVPRTQGNETAESFMGSLRANQHTGLIDPALMLKAMKSADSKGTTEGDLYWLSMGPDNMGGQTTAIVYDNRSNVVYIGSKGGGVYKTYNYGITWHQVGKKNLMVSCMAQAADGTIYVGTGDCGSKTAEYNGLSQQNYSNSFVGSGIFTINANDEINVLDATKPDWNEASLWSFVNDIAIVNGKDIVAATNEALMYSTDKGTTWETLLEGVAMQVKATTDGIIAASVDGKMYIGEPNNLVCHSGNGNSLSGDTLLPKAAGLMDIAIAPSNNNVIYAACIGTDGVHTGVFVSFDKGDHWAIALPNVTASLGNNIYGGYGLYNHGIVVDPANEGRLFILGYNLWKLEKPSTGNGYYLCENISTNTVFYSQIYVHVGLHALAFDPKRPNECYFGTDGGVYKGTASGGYFSFSNSNRNYVTTRMFNVGISGKDTRVLAAGLDHGSVLIEGDPTTNTLGYGVWVNPMGTNQGLFSDDSQAGPCLISNINQNSIFVTTKGGSHLYRSETAGEDWVSTNFLSSTSLNSSGTGISTSSFRLPILMYENFDDDLNPATVWFKNETDATLPSNSKVQVMSNNEFPFEYTLSHSLAVGDSIEIHDPISARMYIAFTDALYMTRQALNFAVETQWYKVTQKATLGFAGEPLSMAISADGDNIFVGMKNGKLFRMSNLNTMVDDASGSISDTTGAYQVTTTEIAMPTNQCVTSIAVDPRDANKVVVTLGNYGNDAYVLYSTNALAEEPVFTAKQGNLPKMPVYSSLIEMTTGRVIIGTEHGIYSTSNIANATWIEDSHSLGDVPVMELKQQLLSHEDMQTVNVTDEGIFTTDYSGVHNTGIIYAATYGRGIFRCENYKQESGAGVPETPEVAETMVTMYPNPVQGEATVSFEAIGGNVSYQVYDMAGRLVMNQNLGNFAQGSQEVRVNMSELSSGSYILRLTQGSNTSCAKFLVY